LHGKSLGKRKQRKKKKMGRARREPHHKIWTYKEKVSQILRFSLDSIRTRDDTAHPDSGDVEAPDGPESGICPGPAPCPRNQPGITVKKRARRESSAQFGKARGELFGRVENTGTGQRIRFFMFFPDSVFHET
jgi:hypothetical protein